MSEIAVLSGIAWCMHVVRLRKSSVVSLPTLAPTAPWSQNIPGMRMPTMTYIEFG